MDDNTFEHNFSQLLLHYGEELEKMSFDEIFNIYKTNKLNNFYSLHKEELIIGLIGKFVDLLETFKEKDINELVNICNKYNIVVEYPVNKYSILLNIMNYVANKYEL